MKTKDIIALAVAAVIFLAAGYIVYSQLLPKKSASQGTKVEIVGPITADFDEATLLVLNDPNKTRDFSIPLDLTTGLNNQAVFGQ